MRIIRQTRLAKRRFARGMNKTVKGAGQKFIGPKPKIGTEGYLTYNPVFNKNVPKGYGYENSLVGGGLARGGMDKARTGRFYSRRAMKMPFAQNNPRQFRNTIAGGVSRFNPMFSVEEYGDVIEFASQAPGIDPSLVQNLIMDASRIQQEGQTKVVISQQLFQQIEAALQNYHIQKQQIDGQSAERMQQGFEAGRQSVFEFNRFKSAARASVKGIKFKQKPRKIPKKIRDLAVDPDAAFLSEHAKGMKPKQIGELDRTDRFLKRREEMLRPNRGKK